MKKILTLALTLGGIAGLVPGVVHAATSPAAANPQPPPAAPAANPQPGDKFAAMIAEKLGLTADQQSRLTALRQTRRTALDAVAADKTLSPEDRRAKVRAIFESGREQMKAVLTPEQQEKMAGEREHFSRHRPDPEQMRFMAWRAQKMMERMRERRAERLGLTEEQQARLRLLAFQQHEKELAMRKEFRAEMEAVLTPEQLAKAREMKERHRPDEAMMAPPPGH